MEEAPSVQNFSLREDGQTLAADILNVPQTSDSAAPDPAQDFLPRSALDRFQGPTIPEFCGFQGEDDGGDSRIFPWEPRGRLRSPSPMAASALTRS